MNDHDYYHYDDYLDEDDYQGSQELTRDEKLRLILVFTFLYSLCLREQDAGYSIFELFRSSPRYPAEELYG